MNLGLGWPADQPTVFRQRLFLPTELSQAWAHTSRQHRPFVTRTRSLLAAPILSDQSLGYPWAGLRQLGYPVCPRRQPTGPLFLACSGARARRTGRRGPNRVYHRGPAPVFAAYAGALQLPAVVAAAYTSARGGLLRAPLVAALCGGGHRAVCGGQSAGVRGVLRPSAAGDWVAAGGTVRPVAAASKAAVRRCSANGCVNA